MRNERITDVDPVSLIPPAGHIGEVADDGDGVDSTLVRHFHRSDELRGRRHIHAPYFNVISAPDNSDHLLIAELLDFGGVVEKQRIGG